MSPEEILKMPYGRIVTPEDDGSFRAEILEFPGCIAVGDTAALALSSLEDVAAGWLAATIAKGLAIPVPFEQEQGFSGRFVLRLSKSLHRRAAYAAKRDGVSLNGYVESAVALSVGATEQRLQHDDRIQFAGAFARGSGVVSIAANSSSVNQFLRELSELPNRWTNFATGAALTNA